MIKVKQLTAILLAGLGICLVSCGSDSNTTATNTSSADYKCEVIKEVKFSQSLIGKTFLDNGVEEATVSRLTDGDTTTFKLKSGGSVTVRYLGIDTPESTAGYDKWGKAASLWNASILSKATSIILESNSSKPEKDSNGTRYLAYVWYKLEGDTEYTNLNLQTVEMGYTKYTGTSTSCKYDSYFKKAAERAKSAKLHVYGKDEDIYYPETIQKVNLKELTTNYSVYYNSETYVPTHVAFDAYLVERSASTSGYVTVKVAQYVEGKEYRITLSLGYTGSTVADMFDETALSRGTLFHICGFTTSDTTVHGLTAAGVFTGDQYSSIKTRYYYSTITDAKITNVENNVITATKGNYTYVITLQDTDSAVNYTIGSTISGHAYNKSNEDPNDVTSGSTTIEFDGYTSQLSTK